MMAGLSCSDALSYLELQQGFVIGPTVFVEHNL